MEREYTNALDPLVTSNGVRCLKGEIHRVIASLRGNARWSTTARFVREIPLHAENPLLRALKTLLIKLESSDDLLEIDTVAYLRPFLDIIVAPETSSHITTAALTSINKFLLYGFLHPEAPRITEAINKLAFATNSCKFEPISTKDAESTLMTLLEVLENIIRCPAGPLLTDDNVWSLLHCSYTLSKIEKSSLLLRKTAEATLSHIVLHVFSNGRRIASRQKQQEMSPLSSSHTSMVAGHSHALQSYGEPVLTRILSWLSSALGDAEARRDTIILALEMINSILETGGPVLGRFASVVYVCQAELCKFLIPVSRSSDPVVLALALRAVFNLFVSMKQHLKVQLEVFFSSVHLYLADNNNSVSSFQRELALESLLEFCREPTLLFDFYINYDCDVACANLFENLVRLLAAAAVPSMNNRLTTLNTVALDGLFAIVAFLMNKLRINLDLHSTPAAAFTEFEETAQPDEGLLQKKLLKKKYGLAAHRFNTDAKHWIQFVQELGLLPSPADPQSVAHFLRDCPGLDKTMVGAYLSEIDDSKHSFQTNVRQSFVQLFDFSGLRIDEALRVFLESFRLPGEAQKIERLMESFAGLVWKQSRGPMMHADAPFVLAYSIIMLNTDLHNRTVKKKMTEEQFVNNNRFDSNHAHRRYFSSPLTLKSLQGH
jgi:brefeldin A-resistance guanine nucleotide exchange factor 1